MDHEKENTKPIQFIRKLCKGRTEKEMQEAELNFREYLLVVKEICNRIERDENSIPDFDESSTL